MPSSEQQSEAPRGPRGRARARRRFWRELVRAGGFVPHMALAAPFQGRERARTRRLLEQGAQRSPEEMQRANDNARRRFRERLGVDAPRRVFLSCGEPSGEGHACTLARALRAALPQIEFQAFGGEALRSCLDGDEEIPLLENLVDHSIMGFRAVLAQVPFFERVVERFVDGLRAWRPDLVVLVDYPGLHLILAEEAKRLGIPVLFYVCPQYWAWAPWRMKRFRRAVDGAIAILPFEAPLFEEQGVPTAFAGSPLLPTIPSHFVDEREEILALLPGSRRAEIARHLGPIVEIWRRFHEGHPNARAILPQPEERRAQRVRDALREIEARSGAIPALELVVGSSLDVLARARAALVKSGTSTLQTALCRTPQFVFFKTSGRSEMLLAKGFLSSAWIAAPNLVLGREAFPETYFAGDDAWSRIESQLRAIWAHGSARDAQLAACDEVRRRVDGPGATHEIVRWLTPAPS